MNTIFGRDVESSASKLVSVGHEKQPISKPNVSQQLSSENDFDDAPGLCEMVEMVEVFMSLRFRLSGFAAVDAAGLGLTSFTRTAFASDFMPGSP